MPKMIAPHGASWRGRALAAGEEIDVTDAEAFQLAAHGFTLAEGSIDSRRDIVADVATMPRKDLLKFLGGRRAGNLFRKPTDELRRLAEKVLVGQSIAEVRDDEG